MLPWNWPGLLPLENDRGLPGSAREWAELKQLPASGLNAGLEP
ncbi:hypothetical protein BJY26_000228 [Spelaeicoccus albus]|uniref:Uncharacterized protein n=1 Tax=Spelaeicoccus albus TaxID=1280376 RepID=A0A7Z0D1A6_9MICO|nr:hypothetical protein [Spelaeicoccus albus]